MNKVKKMTVTTKGLLTGDADAYVRRFQIQLDQFVEDLERFDEALWVLVHDSKDKLYQFLELFMEKEKKKGVSNEKFNEFKKAFGKVRSSGSSLAKDVERTISGVRRTTTNGR